MRKIKEQKKKAFFIDTNIYLDTGADSLFEIGADPEDIVVIPTTTFTELDGLKRMSGIEGKEARKTVSLLEKIIDNDSPIDKSFSDDSSVKKVSRMIQRNNGDDWEGSRFVFYDVSQTTEISRLFSPDISKRDMEYIKAALVYQERHPDQEVVLITNDAILRSTAKINGIKKAETRRKREVDWKKLPKGYHFLDVEDTNIGNLLAKYQQSGSGGKETNRFLKISEIDESFIKNVLPNEYVIFSTKEEEIKMKHHRNPLLLSKSNAVALRYDLELESLITTTYKHGALTGGFEPANFEQHLAIDTLQNDTSLLSVLTGRAGTGKTFLALLASLNKALKLREEKKDAVIYITKPFVNVGEEYGFYKGSMTQKNMMNYIGIEKNFNLIRNKMGKKNTIASFRDQLAYSDPSYEDEPPETPIIQMIPIGHLRGFTMEPHETLILDETQNVPARTMKTIITRIGDGRLILAGDPDPMQLDNPLIKDGYSGLIHTIKSITKTDNVEFRSGLSVVNLNYLVKRGKLTDWATKYL